MLTTAEFIDAANNIASTEDLAELLIRDMRNEGYDNVTFRRVKAGQILLVHCAHLPPTFIEEYYANEFMADDPLVAYGLASKQKFHWADLESSQSLTNSQRDVLNAFRDLGVHDGMSFPFHGPDGSCDLIGLSQRYPEPVDNRRQDTIECKLRYTRWRYWELRQRDAKEILQSPQCDAWAAHAHGPPEMMAHHCRALVFVSVAAQRWQRGFTRFNKNLLTYVPPDDVEFLLSWGLIHEVADDNHFYYYFAPTVLGSNHLSNCMHVPEFRRQVWEMEIGRASLTTASPGNLQV